MASGLLSQRHNHGLPIAICATSLEVNKYHFHFHNDTLIHFHFLSLTLGLLSLLGHNKRFQSVRVILKKMQITFTFIVINLSHFHNSVHNL